MEKFKTIFSPYKTLLKAVFYIGVIALVIVIGRGQLRDLNLINTLASLQTIPGHRIVILTFLGLLTIILSACLDAIVVYFTHLKVSFLRSVAIGWMANAIGNFVGLGGVAGASVRTMLLSKHHIPVRKALLTTVILTPSAILGLCFLDFLSLIGVLDIGFVRARFPYIQWLMAAFTLYIPLYLSVFQVPALKKRFLQDESVDKRLPYALLGFSIIDWQAGVLLFYYICTIMGHPLPYWTIAGIFAVSHSIGLASMVPGGLGTFDLTAMVCLGVFGVSADRAVAMLLLFRVFYYFIPWIFGFALAALELIPYQHDPKLPESYRNIKSLVDTSRTYRYIHDMTSYVIGVLVLLTGFAMVLSGAVPHLPEQVLTLEKLHKLTELVQAPLFLRFSERLEVWIGLVLIFSFKGLKDRVQSFYWVSLGLIGAGMLLSMVGEVNFFVSFLLLVSAVLLLLNRGYFYKKKLHVRRVSVLSAVLVSALATCAYSVIGYMLYSGLLPYVQAKDQPFLHNYDFIINGLVLYLLALAIYILLLRGGRDLTWPKRFEADSQPISYAYQRQNDLVVLYKRRGSGDIKKAIGEIRQRLERYDYDLAVIEPQGPWLEAYPKDQYQRYTLLDERFIRQEFSLDQQKGLLFLNRLLKEQTQALFQDLDTPLVLLYPPYMNIRILLLNLWAILRQLKEPGSSWGRLELLRRFLGASPEQRAPLRAPKRKKKIIKAPTATSYRIKGV